MRVFDYEKTAKMSWETDILNIVAKIHECKGRQDLFERKNPVELKRLVEMAKIQSTESSNRIEGISTSNARMKQLFAEKTTPRNRDENEIMGYRDVLNTIHESHDYIHLKPSTILQLHRDLLKKAGLSFAGHYKNVQNYVSEVHPDGTVNTLFTPVSPFETPDAIERLCEAYNRAIAYEKIDSLLLIPVFICDFLCIHPFNDGNGRMSRLLTLLLLYKSGFTVGKYVSMERQIEKTKDEYYDALRLSDLNWHQGINDPKPFIKYMLRVILACYIEFEERVGIMKNPEKHENAYDIVKKDVEGKVGKFTGAEVVSDCPRIGRSSALYALK